MNWSIVNNYIYTKDEVGLLNVLSVAYVGDCIYELYLRNYITKIFGNIDSHKLHLEMIKYVNAKFQSSVYFKIKDLLTEEELYYFKRGRNSKVKTIPKNCSVVDYKVATGIEAIVGYLYMIGDYSRLDTIFSYIFRMI